MHRQAGCGAGVRLSLQRVSDVGRRLQNHGLGWLTAEERARLTALQAASRRAQFLAGRWLTRCCLAERTGTNWRDWHLSAPDAGAPQVARGPCGVPLHISISHSGDWVGCAIATHPVGVDVERSTRVRDFAALAQWLNPVAGPHQYNTLDVPAQQAAFYTQWTLKEAWVKQAGGRSMDAVHFAPGTSDNQGWVGQGEGLCLALYPATASSTMLCDPPLRFMAWSDWACTPPR